MIKSHAPLEYDCPFCRVLRGEDLAGFYNRQSDVVLRAAHATAFVCPRWWPGNAGHLLVVPNEHVENLYGLEPPLLGHVYEVVRRMAVALRGAYGCEGVSTRQHNEPAGQQEVWHFHCHVFPRYTGDRLYERSKEHRWTTPEERAPYAEKLRGWLESQESPRGSAGC
jgi:histidine triad (HIT) family protein